MITGLSAALDGMHHYSRMFDRAAQQVVRSGMVNPDLNPRDGSDLPPIHDPQAPVGDSMVDGMVNMMIAQRMFLASIRVAQTADEMTTTALELMR